MTENKLTLEDCLKYSNASLINPLGLKTKSVIELINYCYNANITINKLIKIDNLKLILRDISQLTDAEKQYILNNFVYNTKEDQSLITETFYFFSEILAYCRADKTIDLVNYLRKQNILIEPEDWFKSGKAVKK